MAVRNRRLAQLGLFAALATLHTWPLATDPAHLSRLDNDDTAFNTWIIAWVAHQLPRDPVHLFEAPIFHPEHDTLAYSEHMLVQSVMGAPLQWMGVSPVLVYNVLVWAGFVLSGFAMSVLIQQWTGSTTAGVVSGCLYAFNAHLLTRFAHLQALHLEFFPIVLYAFDRLLRNPSGRSMALLTIAFVLQALCSNYTMVLAATALAVALAVRSEPWRRSVRLWMFLISAAIAAGLLLLPFVIPYYRVRAEQGMAFSIDEVQLYSADWRDYLTTAARLPLALGGDLFLHGRTSLFPGFTATALAAAAFMSGVAWRDARARMALAFGLTGFALSFGASLPGYGWLHEHVALLQGIRAAARWGLLLLVAVAILAGFTVAAMETRWRVRWWWQAAALALVSLVTLEALRAPLSLVRFDGIAPVHARLNQDTVTAIVVYPLFRGIHYSENAKYLLDQTRHWQPMVNGYSSFAPGSFFDRAERLQSFPAPAVLDELRAIRVSHVVLHRRPLEQTAAAAWLNGLRYHPELEFVLEQDGVIIYRIKDR